MILSGMTGVVYLFALPRRHPWQNHAKIAMTPDWARGGRAKRAPSYPVRCHGNFCVILPWGTTGEGKTLHNSRPGQYFYNFFRFSPNRSGTFTGCSGDFFEREATVPWVVSPPGARESTKNFPKLPQKLQ